MDAPWTRVKTRPHRCWPLVGSLCVAGLVVGCVGTGTSGGGAKQTDAGPVVDGASQPDNRNAAANESGAVDDGLGNAVDGSEADDDGLDDAVNGSDAADNGSDAVAYDDPPTDDLLDGTDHAEYLSTLKVAHVRTGGGTFLVWVADEPATRQQGLMFVTEEELADLPDGRSRGMLFVYSQDMDNGFWMRNTFVPLDIAFIDAEGSIVTIHTMAPRDDSVYRPDGPYRCALETNAGTFAELGVAVGDFVELP